MKLTTHLIAIFVLLGSYLEQSQVKTFDTFNKIAVLEFDKDVLDYGTIPQYSDGKREFIFTNTGNAPLVIANVKPSCGCTVANYTKEPILPGEKGKIDVSYDTKRLGAFRKSIRVYSNSKENNETFVIKGNVVKKDNIQ